MKKDDKTPVLPSFFAHFTQSFLLYTDFTNTGFWILHCPRKIMLVTKNKI